MTADVTTSNGDTDFFSSSVETTTKSDETPLTSETDATVDTADDNEAEDKPEQESKQQEPSGGGVFSRLFRRNKKQEPTLKNGAADLLDDERPDESSASAAAVTEDEEDDDDDEDSEDEDEGEEEDENSHGNSQQQQDEFDAFGDFNQAQSNDDSDNEDGDEMMSLISGPKTGPQQQGMATANNSRNGLGASLTKFWGFKGKQQQQERPNSQEKEKQSLLHGNYETDEDDEDEEDEDNDQKQGLVRSSSGDYYDANDESDNDDDLRSEPGEYRLESFYPSDSGYHDNPYESSLQTSTNRHGPDLHCRIQGFGSESALNYNHNNAMMDNSSSRYFTNAMSDPRMNGMDANERRGILNGVGKAVSNITQLILQKGRGDVADDMDRKRMLQYISELEHKLVQKERELQSWKERAQQLQLEVDWLKEEDEGKEKDEEEASEEDEFESDNEDEEESNDAKEASLIVFEGAEANAINEEQAGTQEGTLIDVTPAKPVFDPLLDASTQEGSTANKVDEDLMELAQGMEATATATATADDTGNDEKGEGQMDATKGSTEQEKSAEEEKPRNDDTDEALSSDTTQAYTKPS